MTYQDYARRELFSYIKNEASNFLKTKAMDIELENAIEDFIHLGIIEKVFCMIITDADPAAIKIEVENCILGDDRIDQLIKRLESMQNENIADQKRYDRW